MHNKVWLVVSPLYASWGTGLGLLLLSTIAYLPLVGVVLLNMIVPARRVLHADARQGVSDADASREASRQVLLGIGLIVGLTLGQCGALLYSVHDMTLAASAGAPPSLALAQPLD